MDYKQSNVTINGLPMTQTSNPLHIGAPDEPGHDVQQIALRYFQEDQLRVFSIVMLDDEQQQQGHEQTGNHTAARVLRASAAVWLAM